MAETNPQDNAGIFAPTQPSNGAGSTGEGVDRRVPKRLFTRRRMILGGIGLVVLAAIVWALASLGGGRTYRVNADRLRIATVTEAPFQEYVAITGRAQPIRTVFLDAVVSGQVVERLVEEGDMVERGQRLFVLENNDLTLDMLRSEAQIEEQIATLRQNRLALDQNQLNLQQQIAELDHEIEELEREVARTEELERLGAASERELQELRGNLAYQRRRRELTLEAHENDQAQRAAQLEDMESTIARQRRNLSLIHESGENLIVEAPVAGQFSALEAEVGELKVRGARLGQIDVLDEMKVRASVDEHYLPRVSAGQRATATLTGADYELRVRTVYPEVSGGQFEVEMVFEGEALDELRRGQSLRTRLELGEPEPALLLERGAFYADTGGQWVYVLTGEGEAVRRSIRLGRQNPQHYEVLEGLEVGDRVVVSGYETFGEVERLVLK